MILLRKLQHFPIGAMADGGTDEWIDDAYLLNKRQMQSSNYRKML